jgi:transglutaminase-like putative cysteine protease
MSASPARRRALRRPKEPPEDSVRLRLIVGALVMLAVVAVITQGALDAATAAGALLVVPAGYVFSYLRRRRANVVAKAFLAVGLLVALGAFLQRVRFAQTVDEARMPLASLFVWVQALHAFDVPRRRDLAFSVVSSVILMAEAASLSFDTGFAALLVPWAVLAAAWLYATQRPVRLELDRPRFVRRVGPPTRRRSFAVARIASGAAAAVLVAVLAVFLAMPRLPGTYVRLPPFALRSAVPVPSFDGSVTNPSLPSADGDGIVDFSAAAYPGFGAAVDLRARGRLSDRLVMLVRSPQPALWRGQVYDTFDGTTWTESDATSTMIGQATDRGFSIPTLADTSTAGPLAEANRIVTTFYVQTPQPNIVFAAFAPERAYFPAAQLSVGPGTSLRSPILLDRGLVYSVVSNVPVTTPSELRTATGVVSGDAVARYTQVPADLPERDRRLAERITAQAPTQYDRVIAVQRWLRAHTVYDLDVPRDPPGVDAVDEFLFERRRGFCEHIASAMAVLLRSAGVPTRFVTGFGPGERNALTGYFEVREADAHAWVEVLYPGVGWVPYDPTFGVPAADPGATWFVAPDVLRAIGGWLSHAVPEPVRRAVSVAGGAVAFASRVALAAWPLAVALIVLGAVAAWALRRHRAHRAHGPPPTGAAAAFDRLVRALASSGTRRAPSQTPDEYLRAVRAAVFPPGVITDAERIVRTFERARFASDPPATAEVQEALAAARRVSAAVGGR